MGWNNIHSAQNIIGGNQTITAAINVKCPFRQMLVTRFCRTLVTPRPYPITPHLSLSSPTSLLGHANFDPHLSFSNHISNFSCTLLCTFVTSANSDPCSILEFNPLLLPPLSTPSSITANPSSSTLNPPNQSLGLCLILLLIKM